ncbi:MAG: HNH endonuclease [Armatimonadota bacterium]|nr:HNH endonuclease [Armatimonadota bacterium]
MDIVRDSCDLFQDSGRDLRSRPHPIEGWVLWTEARSLLSIGQGALSALITSGALECKTHPDNYRWKIISLASVERVNRARTGDVDGQRVCMSCGTFRLAAEFATIRRGQTIAGKMCPNCRLAVQVRMEKQRAIRAGCTEHLSLEEWRDCLARHDYKCVRCGSSANLSIDHIVALTHGGRNTIDNVQALCTACNTSKNARRTLTEVLTDELRAALSVYCIKHAVTEVDAIRRALALMLNMEIPPD